MGQFKKYLAESVITEGTMAHGIFDRDPTIAKKAIKELKARLKQPILDKDFSNVLYPYLFDDRLYGTIEDAYRKTDDNYGKRDITKNSSIMDDINGLIRSAEKLV